MLEKLLKRIPYLEALRGFLEQWGLWKYLVMAVAAMITGAVALWSWLESHLPYWAIALVFLATATLLIIAFNSAIEMYRKITAEHLDSSAVADSLIDLSSQMARAINDFARERAIHLASSPPPTDPQQEWENSMREGRLIVLYIQERFGSRIISSLMLLSKLEIKIPAHFIHISSHNLMGLASYFGAVGNLIKSGNVSVAKTLDDKTSWQVSGIIGQ